MRKKNGPFKVSARRSQSEYAIWSNIKQRCCNPDNDAYPNYGGRGILLCDAWQTFEGFLAGVGKRPAPNLTLDRIDNDKGYEPGNVRWTTRKVQAQNKRSVTWLEIDGTKLALPDFAKRVGVSYATAYRWHRTGELEQRLGRPLWTVLHPAERCVHLRAKPAPSSPAPGRKVSADV